VYTCVKTLIGSAFRGYRGVASGPYAPNPSVYALFLRPQPSSLSPRLPQERFRRKGVFWWMSTVSHLLLRPNLGMQAMLAQTRLRSLHICTTLYTPHPAPQTHTHTPYSIRTQTPTPKPCTPHPTPYTPTPLHPYTLSLKPETRNEQCKNAPPMHRSARAPRGCLLG
jgi:hypothetical protein